MSDRLIGRELDGRYTVLDRVGKGMMGTVYRGRQHSVGRDVAIKVIAPALASDETVVKRFFREAQLASKLSHPNAVSVLDFGRTPDGVFYLVMELVAGRTLETTIAEDFPLPVERIVKIGVQICDALECAHEVGIIHRDLKPQNVMIGKRDFVKVLDFGLAKSLSGPRDSMTAANAVLGSPAYMPPEFFRGKGVDTRGDLYSLGCVLYVAATGALPFPVATLEQLLRTHERGDLPDVANLPQLAPIVLRLLAKTPAARYQTAGEVRDALEATRTARIDPVVVANAERRRTVMGWAPSVSNELAALAGLDIPGDIAEEEPTKPNFSGRFPTVDEGDPDVESADSQIKTMLDLPPPVRPPGK